MGKPNSTPKREGPKFGVGSDVGRGTVWELTKGRSIEQILTTAGDATMPKLLQITANMQKEFHNRIDNNISDTLKTVLTATELVSWGLAFSSAILGLAKVYSAYQGQAAESALMELGVQIAKSLKSAADCAEQQLNINIQEKFADHIHDYVSLASSTSPDTLIFVYHPGTDWHPKFFSKVAKEPLPQLASVFSDLETMLIFLSTLRKVAGPTQHFKILIPSTQIFAIPEEVALCPSLLPLTIECEKNGAGKAYVHMNVPGAPPSIFSNVVNISKAPKTESWKRWAAANAGCWATALPIAAAGTVVSTGATLVAAETTILGGLAFSVGAGTAAGATAIAAPAVIVIGLPLLLAASGWAAYEGAMASKRSVREGFRNSDELKEKEAAKVYTTVPK